MSPLVITLITVFSILGFLIILYFILSYVLAFYLTHPKRFSKEFTHKVDVDKGLIPSDMSYMKREEIEIELDDGSLIRGDISEKENARGIMIIAHGYTWNRKVPLNMPNSFIRMVFQLLYMTKEDMARIQAHLLRWVLKKEKIL